MNLPFKHSVNMNLKSLSSIKLQQFIYDLQTEGVWGWPEVFNWLLVLLSTILPVESGRCC